MRLLLHNTQPTPSYPVLMCLSLLQNSHTPAEVGIHKRTKVRSYNFFLWRLRGRDLVFLLFFLVISVFFFSRNLLNVLVYSVFSYFILESYSFSWSKVFFFIFSLNLSFINFHLRSVNFLLFVPSGGSPPGQIIQVHEDNTLLFESRYTSLPSFLPSYFPTFLPSSLPTYLTVLFYFIFRV